MRRRKRLAGFHEPSLVPMADMLTNTVGVMIFILIFTVLTAAGALVPKRLPMEHPTETSALYFVCEGDRLLPLNVDLQDQFVEPLGKPTYATANSWLARFNRRQIEDEFFVVTGEGESYYYEDFFRRGVQFDLAVLYTPRPERGETKANLQFPNSRFRQILNETKPEDHFVYFFLYPNSLDVFASARAIAVSLNFGTGWGPRVPDTPIRFSLTGSGRRSSEQ